VHPFETPARRAAIHEALFVEDAIGRQEHFAMHVTHVGFLPSSVRYNAEL